MLQTHRCLVLRLGGIPHALMVFCAATTRANLIPRGGVRVEAQPVELSKVTGPDNSSSTGLISFSKINVLGEYLD